MKKFMLFLLRTLPIEEIARYVIKVLTKLDDQVIDYIYQKVVEMDKNSGLAGFEKRELVYKQVKETFNDLSDYAINLAIEMFVALLKSKVLKAE